MYAPSQAPSAEELEKAKAISEAAASFEQASRVKMGSVLSIALSPARVCGATVMSIVSSLNEIRVTVKWDDGDELFGNTLVLFGLQVPLLLPPLLPIQILTPSQTELQAVRFKLEDTPPALAVRLGKTRLSDLFRGPDSARVGTETTMSPLGIFALTMGSDYHAVTSSGEKRSNGASFATALADFKEYMVVSAAVNQGSPSQHRTLPRMFDLVAKFNSTTGLMTEMSVCLGIAFKCKERKVETDDIVILGTPIAMMHEGGQYAPKALELTTAKLLSTAQRRYGPDDFKDPLVITKMLATDSDLRLRRIDSISELATVVGAKLVEQLKTLLLSWHVLDGMRNARLLGERETLLSSLAALSSPTQRVASRALPPLGEAILVQGATSMALQLQNENKRAAKTETALTASAREARFFAACDNLVGLLLENSSFFGCTSLDASGKKKVEDKLRNLKPELPTRTEKRLQDEAHGPKGGAGPRNGKEAREQRKKREAQHGAGVSPAGPQKQGVPKKASEDGDPSSADVRARGAGMANLFNSLEGEKTVLAAHQFQSAELTRLRCEKEQVEANLAKVIQELADEKMAHALTRAELSGLKGSTSAGTTVFSQLSTALTDVARLREKVKQQKKTIERLEYAANHNQAMFLAKLDMDAEKVSKFMPSMRSQDSDDDE